MKQEKRRYPRANIQWHVKVHSPEGSVEGVTKNVSPLGAFIRCARPLKLNEICEVTIDTPDRALQAKAEVVWSNVYGPDDDGERNEITRNGAPHGRAQIELEKYRVEYGRDEFRISVTFAEPPS